MKRTWRMNAEHRVLGLELLRSWLVANFLALTVGGAVAGGLLRVLEEPYYGSDISALEAALVQAVIVGLGFGTFGAVLGTAQWLVLRRALSVGWWAPATCLGFAVAGAITGFLAGGAVSTIGPAEGPAPPVVKTLVGYPLSLLGLGAFQWLVLRRQLYRAGWWLVGNLGGLILGFAVAL